MKQAILRWCMFAAAAMPAVLPLWIILNWGVDVPASDQWSPEFAGLYAKFHHGQLGLFDFTAQHNEHRIVIPRLIGFGLNLITRWNTVDEMLLGWVVVCLTSLGLLRLIVVTYGAGQLTRGVAALWLVINLLIFSTTQWENWLWGIGIANFMPMFWIVAAMVVMQSGIREGIKLCVAGLCAGAAMFSSGNGVLAWPLIGIFLVCHARDKWKWFAWGSGFLVCLLIYFHNYHSPTETVMSSHDPSAGEMLEYFLLSLGNAIVVNRGDDPVGPALGAGIATVLLFAAAIVFSRQKLIPWLICACFAVASGLIAAIFRARFGLASAFASRYATFAVYLPLGLVMSAAILAQNAPRIRPLSTFFIALVVAAQLWALPTGMYASWLTHLRGRQAKGVMLLMIVVPEDDLIEQLVYHDASLARDEALALDKLGYLRPHLIRTNNAANIQSRDSAAQSPGRIEQLQSDQHQIALFGWAISRRRRTPADTVFLTCDNESGEPIIFAIGGMGTERPDIAAALGDQRYLRSGWIVVFPESRLPARASLKIRAWSLDADTGEASQLEKEATIQRSAASQPL